jgi:hypothetical protein
VAQNEQWCAAAKSVSTCGCGGTSDITCAPSPNDGQGSARDDGLPAAAKFQDYLVSRGNLRPKSGIADPERQAGDAVTMLAEQVRDDVCDLVGCARPVDFERHRVDGDVTLTQL